MFLIKIFILFFISLMLILFILINKINLMKKKINNSLTIECGFNNFNNKHIPMMNNFFSIMIIFMIFDLEFFLLIPLINLMKNFNWMKTMMMLILTLMFMFYSMMYEISFKSINWIK